MGRPAPAARALPVRRWVGALAALAVASGLLAGAAAQAKGPVQRGAVVALADLPPEAQRTLALIHRGGPFPYQRDGVNFGNYERRLPQRARGYYTEYTVPTPGRRDRGPRRIIAGRGPGGPATSGEYWYTGDHYRSFARIEE